MWFTETPWPPIYICFGLFLLLFVYGVSTGRGKAATIGLGCLAVCPLLFFLERFVVTEAEVVEQVVLDLASDVQENRQQEVINHLSDNESTIGVLIRSGMSKYDLSENLRITDLSVEVDPGGQSAKAHLRANGTVRPRGNSGMQGQRFPSRWHVYFERDNDEWKVTQIERLSPTSGKTMPILATRIQ
ncbi:hypothetical protein Pla110_33880 [Polystyrenella longa]|uniref:DUF4440 domain-containing protein n=1 Tax=Polystyrenella longa TaxID=2528007 RepID=A0A518CR12_9PLAN|nr:hypothetical protein [Polystyrenella longa]QDU81644.1 hypothetical protein Pla110_33880 [Polystyrenella longa]